MTREHYIKLRLSNRLGDIVYTFYKQECLKLNISILGPNEFITLFNMWEHANESLEMVLSYYESKFEIVIITYKNKIIKIV